MLLSFRASDIECEEEDDVYFVSFLNSKGGKYEYVTLQNPREYSEQDISLGMDKVYIERDDQFFASYGGIEGVNVHRRSINIHLSDEAAKKLDDIEEIEINFDISDEEFHNLISILREIFKEQSTYEARESKGSESIDFVRRLP